MTPCFIALGSNLDKPFQQLSAAVTALSALPNSSLHSISPWYSSKAIGPGEQPDYLNGVVELHTTLSANDLLTHLQGIENRQLRIRKQHWGPRTLDLDLLLYGKQTLHSERLTLPHPRLHERNFVLYPLFDIAPDLQLPDGMAIRSLLDNCARDNLTKAPANQQYSNRGTAITNHGDCQ